MRSESSDNNGQARRVFPHFIDQKGIRTLKDLNNNIGRIGYIFQYH